MQLLQTDHTNDQRTNGPINQLTEQSINQPTDEHEVALVTNTSNKNAIKLCYT